VTVRLAPYSDAVLNLWAGGYKPAVISQRLGDPLDASRVMAIVKAGRREGDPRAAPRGRVGGPTNTVWTEDRCTLVREMVEAGESTRAIASAIGMTKGQVAGYIARAGLKLARAPVGGYAGIKTASVSVPSGKRPPHIAFTFKRKPIDGVKPEPGYTDRRHGIARIFDVQDLTLRTCRWPIGDPREADFGYCGGEAKVGSSYCQHHRRIAYTVRSDASPDH